MKRHIVRQTGHDAPSTATETDATRAPIWIWVIQAFLGYEWLVSGVNKILNARFDAQLAPYLRQSAQVATYGWYASFVRQLVIPNHLLFGVLTEIGETAIGAVLVIGAGLAVFRPRWSMSMYAKLVAGAALLGSVFLSLNYFFQTNAPVPWLNANNSLTQGVDITIIIAFISAALLATNLHAAAADRLAGFRLRRAELVPARVHIMTHDDDLSA